jgi:hypothetical protein
MWENVLNALIPAVTTCSIWLLVEIAGEVGAA